jgi:hypothetical protein
VKTLNKVIELDQEKTKLLTVDALLLALRWDLIPWSLVLDLDTPISEAVEAPYRRAWIVFGGVSEIYFPIHNARLPNGCGLISQISISELTDDFKLYEFCGLLPSFSKNDSIIGYPSKDISIKAKEITGLISIETRSANINFIDRQTRVNLASDEEFLFAFMSSRDEGAVRGA